MHVLKDCTNHVMSHELVPIVTKNDTMLPEVLDNLPPPPPAVAMHIQHQNVQHKQIQSHLQAQQLEQHQQQILQSSCISTLPIGVYTLAEEPELEAEENTNM